MFNKLLNLENDLKQKEQDCREALINHAGSYPACLIGTSEANERLLQLSQALVNMAVRKEEVFKAIIVIRKELNLGIKGHSFEFE